MKMVCVCCSEHRLGLTGLGSLLRPLHLQFAVSVLETSMNKWSWKGPDDGPLEAGGQLFNSLLLQPVINELFSRR